MRYRYIQLGLVGSLRRFHFCYFFESVANASGGERKDFLNEMDMMKRIAEGKHTHVVSLVGCITIKEPLCLITEYLMYGNLLSYLETIRELVSSYGGS